MRMSGWTYGSWGTTASDSYEFSAYKKIPNKIPSGNKISVIVHM